MNRDELIDVLTVIQVVDHRTIGEADITVWGDIIGKLPKDLALQAVRNHRRECPGIWLEPGHIIAGVRAIRRDQRERERAELYDREIAEKINIIAAELAAKKTIPADAPARSRPDPVKVRLLQVACPHCHASPGQRCYNGATKRPLQARAHPARLEAAAASNDTPRSENSEVSSEVSASNDASRQVEGSENSELSAVAVADRACLCGREILDDNANACDRCTPVINGPQQPNTNGNSSSA